MAANHSVYAMMVGMSENWWRSGIMPCVRSDLERDKPVAYIFWLVEGPHSQGGNRQIRSTKSEARNPFQRIKQEIKVGNRFGSEFRVLDLSV